jgi:hypothetical protein
MDDKVTTISYSLFTNKGAFALLLGSGISRSSGIPTGWDIVLDIINQIALLKKNKCDPSPEEWYIKVFEEEPDYSNLLEKLTVTQEERLNLLRPYFEADEDNEEGLKRPTKAHKFIAQLVKKGYIKLIITTNFDRLIENALKEIGIEPVVISNPNHIENTIPLIHSKITLIKINGDYLDTSFLNIKSELIKYDPRLEKLLIFIFENFGLITCGWSAKWDLALVTILKSANKFRFSNYFTFLNNAENELVELSNIRLGKTIEIQDADSFFSELSENVDALESNLTYNPLTPKIALARLKKYIVRDEFIISLNDLIQSQTENVFERLNSTSFPHPNNEEIKKKIDFYLSQIDPLCSLLMHGVYWGKELHDELWIKTLTRIATPKEKSNNYTIWQEIEYLPALIIVYVLGLTCVLKNKYGLLLKISKIDIINQRGEEKLLKLANSWQVIDKRILQQVLGNNHHVPMSELLFYALRKHFENYILNDKEYENLFDNFEYLMALIYTKKISSGWAPVGRFGYRIQDLRSNIIPKKLEEIKNKKNTSELITTGLFESYIEFDEVNTKFNEFFKNVHFY